MSPALALGAPRRALGWSCLPAPETIQLTLYASIMHPSLPDYFIFTTQRIRNRQHAPH